MPFVSRIPSEIGPKCPILDLPVEIRLQIYNYVYQPRDSNTKCEPTFILRDDTTILQPLHRWFPHVGAGLLKTCHKIHNKAAPIMYDLANFRINVYIGDGWPRYQYAGPVDATNPLIRQMRHVELTIHLSNEAHIDPAFARLRLFAQALEEGKADLKTCRVTFKAVTSYLMAVTRDLVAGRREEVLRRLAEGEGMLFRRMLVESMIVSVN